MSVPELSADCSDKPWPELSADCSDKPWFQLVLTKNFRTSNFFRIFFFHDYLDFYDPWYCSIVEIYVSINQYILSGCKLKFIHIHFSILTKVHHLRFFPSNNYLSIIHNKVRKLFTDSSAKKCRTCSKFGSSAIPEVVWALLINIDIE